MQSQIILVPPSDQCRKADAEGLPLLRMGLGIHSNGTLVRALAQEYNKGDLLCVSDFGVSVPIPNAVARQLLQETQTFAGIVADFERFEPLLDDFLKQLDAICAQAQIPLFVPHRRIASAPHAWTLAPSAASGGCLREELERGMEARHGRLAVSFRRTCRRFRLPSADPNGEELTISQLSALHQQKNAQIFFSQELCVNYFTYMEGNIGYFVLFDDKNTLQKRLHLLQRLEIPYIFADWESYQFLIS